MPENACFFLTPCLTSTLSLRRYLIKPDFRKNSGYPDEEPLCQHACDQKVLSINPLFIINFLFISKFPKMKKSIVMSAAAIISAMTLSFTGSYAANGRKTAPTHSKAMIIVHRDFPQVQNVTWLKEGKDQIALFTVEDRHMQFTFNGNGSLESTMITTCNAWYLPFELQTSLNKKYPGYVPKTISEYIGPNAHTFYVLLKKKQEKEVTWMRVKADEDGNAIEVIQQLHQNV